MITFASEKPNDDLEQSDWKIADKHSETGKGIETDAPLIRHNWNLVGNEDIVIRRNCEANNPSQQEQYPSILRDNLDHVNS